MDRGLATPEQRRVFWYLPIGFTVANFLYWPLMRDTGLGYPFFLMFTPLAFGLLGVGTTTRKWKVWVWDLSWFHVAFLYSAYGQMFPLFMNDSIAQPWSALTVVKSTVLIGLLCMITGTVFDMHSVDEGKLHVPHAPYQGESTVKKVASYSYWFFGWLALCTGLQAQVAWHYLVELGRGDLLWPLIAAGFAFMSGTTVTFFAINQMRDRMAARSPRPASAG